ncbi:hypothetical protein DFAR_840004 [Desulfarculales bacterium]
MLRPLDLAVNCRVKRDHHLLRLESSSTTAPTGGLAQGARSGYRQLLQGRPHQACQKTGPGGRPGPQKNPSSSSMKPPS